ncbi:MAG TPA: cyclic nucleotide-binding domain-containing protein [Roseiflexaceae bacterium]|nr:cyclic nucleotide-binding domain-containing protein [Roseiflexaceae bacterium]
MAIIVAESSIEQSLGRQAPGGLWDRLAHSADAPAIGAGDVWRGLERRLLTSQATAGTGMWAALAQRVDPAQYCPHAVPDVAEEEIVEGGQRLTVIRSPRGNYLRLTDLQRELWHQMDGMRTVAQLATQAFLQFKQLLPVGDLVTALRVEGFLNDQPVGVYASLATALEARTAEGWGRRLLRALSSKAWRFERIDRFYGTIYRTFGWLFFTPLFLTLWALVALAGLGAFVALLLGYGAPPAVVASNTVLTELVALWCVLLVSFFLHESAHALTVKHYRRTLPAGGLMLYFGMPAFFVDTSDIWRSPRRARMLVSAAGPMSDLFVGALAALLVLLRPGETLLNSVSYKLAFTCYIATLFNTNPLLELDGYYILVDWLRLPDLRRRALEFVRGPLWGKLARRTTRDERPETNDAPTRLGPWSLVLGPFTREERIFTAYGVLTLLYSAIAIAFALQFWNRKLIGTIQDLWSTGATLPRLVAAALIVLVLAPVLAGLLFAGLGLGRAALAWIIRRGYGRQPALLASVALAAVLLLAVLTNRVTSAGTSNTWLIAALPPLLWIVALIALLSVRPDYRRAAVAPTLNALTVTTALAGLAAVARAGGLPNSAWMVADGLALMFLLVAGFAALLDVDLRVSTPRELLITALLLMLAFGVGATALLLVPPLGAPMTRIAAAAPAYFGALALALLFPHLFDLRDSRLIWSWALMWLAALIQTSAYVADIGSGARIFDLLAAGLWAASWLVHLATLRQIAPDEILWPDQPSMSEEQRLRRAFQFCYAGCYRLLRAVYGARRTTALDDRMDVLAATANWDVTLDRDRVRIAPGVQALPLDMQGARYAEVLRYAVATIEQIAGATFARRAIQAAYDALPWPERETASRYCFPDTPWARELSSAFGDVRDGRLRLLRQVEHFLNCDDDELATLAHAIQEQHVAPETLLLRAGAPALGVWVVEAGEIVALRGGQVVAELHRGDSFGEVSALGRDSGSAEASPSELSYRAAISSSLLFIPASELAALARRAPQAADAHDTAATLRLLERVPLFEDLPRNTLRGLAHIAEQRQFDARAVIVRQGVPSGVFYVIKQGRAAVLARGEPKGDAPPQIRKVAQLGQEEFFGELELLRGTPPLASVVALTPLTVLALPHAAVQAFILGDGRVARGLEQVGTGRLIALRARA